MIYKRQFKTLKHNYWGALTQMFGKYELQFLLKIYDITVQLCSP